jgi:hypothetical protein
MKTIPLTQGKEALVDDEDYDELNKYKWHAHLDPETGQWCAVRNLPRINGKRKNIKMHRQIMGDPIGKSIDHKNHDRLDNRKSNLRICSHSQNNSNIHRYKNNTSGLIGVRWHKRDTKWEARISKDNKQINLGYFDDKFEAARVRDKKAKELHGEFATLNFPE